MHVGGLLCRGQGPFCGDTATQADPDSARREVHCSHRVRNFRHLKQPVPKLGLFGVSAILKGTEVRRNWVSVPCEQSFLGSGEEGGPALRGC